MDNIDREQWRMPWDFTSERGSRRWAEETRDWLAAEFGGPWIIVEHEDGTCEASRPEGFA